MYCLVHQYTHLDKLESTPTEAPYDHRSYSTIRARRATYNISIRSIISCCICVRSQNTPGGAGRKLGRRLEVCTVLTDSGAECLYTGRLTTDDGTRQQQSSSGPGESVILAIRRRHSGQKNRTERQLQLDQVR
jgi:hypothetical protein